MSLPGSHRKQNAPKQSANDHQSQSSQSARSDLKLSWQHPYVDVFKHFKVQPNADWKLNKRQGDVTETFAKEIGRKAVQLNGNISANNFIQIPHPDANMKAPLGLTGRYLYLQVKAPVASSPLSFHFDLVLAERSHGIRISASNLYKTMTTQNGFAVQVPLVLDVNRFSVVVFDIYEILKQSKLLPADYMIPGCYQIKTLTLCACSVVRGVYTSDNMYDFATLPPDMRFKFSFQNERWPEYFTWLELPAHLSGNTSSVEQQRQKISAKPAQPSSNEPTEQQKQQMEKEISEMLESRRRELGKAQKAAAESKSVSDATVVKRNQCLLSGDLSQGGVSAAPDSQLIQQSMEQRSGQLVGSTKLSLDPIMELQHVIGYSPEKCKNIKWSRLEGDNSLIFSAGGTLIVMDTETNQQHRYFFGHTSPICCFDLANHGMLVVSAEERNPIIRIWEYKTARCISMVSVPDTDEKGKKLPGAAVKGWTCVAFSPDGHYFASVGKGAQNKELIVVWDISNIYEGGKPEILAKHTSEFNVLCLKFSPVDNTTLVSCGKENIRFWKIKHNQNIRGSAVVLDHHTRDTVFTSLDFGWSCPDGIQTNNPESRRSQELDRVFVASKSGVVFQVNYHTMKLEQAYRTIGNDAMGRPVPIHSIASNYAFCATGSADNQLKVWTLDFSSFTVDMQFEGTVSALEISPDGLKIACGTQNGSLGILDKTQFKFRMLIRAQTKQIVSMDFHQNLNLIITVSNDMTIRLFDMQTYEQSVEFMSKVDQPICVAAHPYLNIFSCGFASGNMCIFDIEKTCVTDQMNQLKKAIKKIAYSPCGSLLVACCEDGSTALHNAKSQHLPTKMMHLEFPPKYIHVAFSPIIQKVVEAENIDQTNFYDLDEQEQFMLMQQRNQSRESMFAVMGENGNNILIYDTETIMLKHQIQAGHTLRSFEFSKDGKEIILVTDDQRIKFYSLATFSGDCYKELPAVHRGGVNCSDLSLNGGFMLTGGDDSLIKVWDYDAQRNLQSQFQAFIGHINPITDAKFNPRNNKSVVTIAGDDGVYFWKFLGDTSSDFFHTNADCSNVESAERRQLAHQPTLLEQMRASVKEKKQRKLPEGSFVVQPFVEVTRQVGETARNKRTPELTQFYEQVRIEKNLPFNHFISVNEAPLPRTAHKVWSDDDEAAEMPRRFVCKPDSHLKRPLIEGDVVDAALVNGYDGFGGVHDNLIWNAAQGHIIYTLNNKVIREQTKSREQSIICESAVRISCLAQYESYLAVGEGEQGPDGRSNIYIYKVDIRQPLKQHCNIIKHHMHGVQAMCMTRDLLVSMEAHFDSQILVSQYHKNLVVAQYRIDSSVLNAMFLNPFLTPECEILEFFTVGTNGDARCWHYDEKDDLQYLSFDLDAVPHLKETDFTCAVPIPEFKGNKSPFTQAEDPLAKPFKILIGTKDGSVVMLDKDNQDRPWIQNGKKVFVSRQESIGHIVYRKNNNSLVITDSAGEILRFNSRSSFTLDDLQAPKDLYRIRADSAITSLQMDDNNHEGIVGTQSGDIMFVQIPTTAPLEPHDKPAHQIIRIVTRATSALDQVQMVWFDKSSRSALKENVFLSGCGPDSSEVKLYVKDTFDQVISFPGQGLSPVQFVCGTSRYGKNRIVGHKNGEIRLIELEKLKVNSSYHVELSEGDQLSCGAFNDSGHNFAFGTDHGSVYLGVIKADSRHKIHITKLASLTRVDGRGVTSLQLSNFIPDGNLLVAYDNGLIQVWQSEQQIRLTGTKGKDSNHPREIEESCQFNSVDQFDLYLNPYRNRDDLTDEDRMYAEMKRDSRYHCEVVLAPGTHDQYFCFSNTLQWVYLRRFTERTTLRHIQLGFFPTSISLADFSATGNLLGNSGKAAEEFLFAVGSEEGRAVVYKLEPNDTQKTICTTKRGLHYGACTSVALTNDGRELITASQSGELLRFCLKDSINKHAS